MRVKKENRGSFGTHRRGKEEMVDANAIDTEVLDEVNQVITAGDRALAERQLRG